MCLLELAARPPWRGRDAIVLKALPSAYPSGTSSSPGEACCARGYTGPELPWIRTDTSTGNLGLDHRGLGLTTRGLAPGNWSAISSSLCPGWLHRIGVDHVGGLQLTCLERRAELSRLRHPELPSLRGGWRGCTASAANAAPLSVLWRHALANDFESRGIIRSFDHLSLHERSTDLRRACVSAHTT